MRAPSTVVFFATSAFGHDPTLIDTVAVKACELAHYRLSW